MGSIAQINGADERLSEFKQLPNGRWRLTRRIPFQNAGNVGDKLFGVLGEQLSVEYATKEDETKFTNLRLIDQGAGEGAGKGGSAQPMVTKVYETLTKEFVAEVEDVTDYEMNGLKRTRRTLIAAAGTSVEEFVVDTQEFGSAPVQYLASVRIEEDDAFTRVLAEYLAGGVVRRSERLLDGGLKEVVIRSFHDQNAEAGIGTTVTVENELGYPVWETTTLQKSDGGVVTEGIALTTVDKAPFMYPGRAKPYLLTETLATSGGPLEWTFVGVFLSPPVEAQVETTTEVSYTLDNDIGTLVNAFWNPTEWATVRAYWINTGDQVSQKLEGLRGYRTAGSVVAGVASDPTQTTIFGEPVFASSGFSVVVTGGPEAPDGNTYTLDYSVVPAFTDTTGVQYYRRTVTYATIPAQEALPV